MFSSKSHSGFEISVKNLEAKQQPGLRMKSEIELIISLRNVIFSLI